VFGYGKDQAKAFVALLTLEFIGRHDLTPHGFSQKNIVPSGKGFPDGTEQGNSAPAA